MHPFRIFLSHCSEDQSYATRLEDVLSSMELTVFWSHKLTPGNPFTDEIKEMIGRSHLFIILLTQEGKDRPWVHQETGYAMGVGVPILPIALDDTYPDALIKQLQALRLEYNSLNDAGNRQKLASAIEERVGHRYPYEPENYMLTQSPERRTECLVEFASQVKKLGGGRVRQRGALTSFHLPTSKPIDDDTITDEWKERDGKKWKERSHSLRELLFKERSILGALAKDNGCSLIMTPDIRLGNFGDPALLLRQKKLLSFLHDEDVMDVKPIVLMKPRRENITIVGDWFYAESRNPIRKGGYSHTFFTWHAPTVLRKLKEFDADFESLRKHEKIESSLLRRTAQDRLEKIIAATKARVR